MGYEVWGAFVAEREGAADLEAKDERVGEGAERAKGRFVDDVVGEKGAGDVVAGFGADAVAVLP